MKHTFVTDDNGIRHAQNCNRCGSAENLTKRQYTKKYRVQYYMCRDCNTELMQKYRKTKNGMAIVRKASYKSMDKHRKKQNCRALMNYHLRKGRIEKPKECSMCHEEKKLDGHHDDYSKPLEVTWVCRACHFQIHKRCTPTVERV